MQLNGQWAALLIPSITIVVKLMIPLFLPWARELRLVILAETHIIFKVNPMESNDNPMEYQEEGVLIFHAVLQCLN